MNKKLDFQTILQLIQLLILLIGISGFFIDIGRQSESLRKTTVELSELKSIVQDLIKSQITIASNDSRHQALLDDLKYRVSLLEKRDIHAN